ncbi:MAG: gliding motility protein GldB [Prevotella sp.]|jgi:hypothetical protein|nr:gliding motility protein GldB [Prevotella sp.]
MVLCVACEFKLTKENDSRASVEVVRYDRLESRYLTTGDFSALQQMNVDYPVVTRTLVENVLKLGAVYEPDINSKFLSFYQDTILQAVIADTEAQYANMTDVNESLSDAFDKLQELIPSLRKPEIFALIGALNQSIIVGDNYVGVCLDKYLGKDYPLYKKYYTAQQRESMSAEYIASDCVTFYLLSLYPLKDFEQRSQHDRDLHMGKIMYVANVVTGKNLFTTPYVKKASKMKKASKLSFEEFLKKDK